jgi:hypothetical protein
MDYSAVMIDRINQKNPLHPDQTSVSVARRWVRQEEHPTLFSVPCACDREPNPLRISVASRIVRMEFRHSDQFRACVSPQNW